MKKFNLWLCVLLTTICLFSSVASAFELRYNKNEELTVFDQSHDHLIKLDNSISQLYDLASQKNKKAVFQSIQQIKKQLNDPLLMKYGTASGWKHMKQDIVATEAAIVDNQPSTVWREYISSLRLASDSLLQSEHGPWLQYESVLLDDIRSVKVAGMSTVDKKVYDIISRMTIYANRAARMEAAAYMVGDELRIKELMERNQQLTVWLDDVKDQVWTVNHQKQLNQAIDGIVVTIHSLFAQATETITLPDVPVSSGIKPTFFAFIIGTLISSILTYIAYRKYKQLPYGVKKI